MALLVAVSFPPSDHVPGTAQPAVQSGGAPLRSCVVKQESGHSLGVLEGSFAFRAVFDLLLPCIRESNVYAGCAEITEVPQTHVCVFRSRDLMNRALHRVSSYIEQEKRIKNDAEIQHGGPLHGHDLKGEDLTQFYQAFQRQQRHAVDRFGHIAIENHFWKTYIQRHLARQPDLILLAGYDGELLQAVFSHEISHARYFRYPAYQAIIRHFWHFQVSEVDRNYVTQHFKQEGSLYNITANPDLLYNEFQAFALQIPDPYFGAEFLRRVQIYKTRLRHMLTEGGFPAVEFN